MSKAASRDGLLMACSSTRVESCARGRRCCLGQSLRPCLLVAAPTHLYLLLVWWMGDGVFGGSSESQGQLDVLLKFYIVFVVFLVGEV